MDKFNSIELAINKLGKQLFSNLNIEYILSEEPNLLTVKKVNNKVSIIYSEKNMLFRGLTLIKEHINEDNFIFGN